MPFNVGILAGLGERYREDREQQQKRNENLLKSASSTWEHIFSDPSISPEGKNHALRMILTAGTADPTKKMPKELSDLTPIQQGLPPSPGREFTKTEPQQAAQVSPLQPPTSFDMPVPFTPQDRVGMFRSPSEMQQEELAGYRKKLGIQHEFDKDKFMSVAPGNVLVDPLTGQTRGPYGQKQDMTMNEVELAMKAAQGDVQAQKALELLQGMKTQSQKSLEPKEVLLNGKRAVVAFNPDPKAPGWYKIGPDGKLGENVSAQMTGLYHEPPATIQIEGMSNAAANQAASGAGGGSAGSNLSEGLMRATANLQPAKKLQVSNAVNTLVKAGKVDAAKATVRQAALDSEQDPQLKREATGRRISIQTLGEISKLLTQVPQGIIGGTVEDTYRRLGKTTDPRMVALGNRLEVLLQAYRKSITGAQFGVQESREYEKIFPSYKNDPGVNQALIKSLTDQFKLQDSVYWDYKLGPGWSDAAVTPTSVPSPGANPALKNLSNEELFKRLQGK